MAAFDINWDDITPIPQNDGTVPVAAIAYSPEFTQLMDIFRGVVAKGEQSERVLVLIKQLLHYNAANYTIWQYRRECLLSLDKDLNDELDYIDGFAADNPKSYQIWHHRKAIIDLLGNGSREPNFCEAVFKVDSKNYHAWSHRQWAIKKFSLWSGELDFIEKTITEDAKNNSAWSQRWFFVHDGPEPVTLAVLQRELEYTWNQIAIEQLNESAWNYARGIYDNHGTEFPELNEDIKNKCHHYCSIKFENVPSSSTETADITTHLLDEQKPNVFAMALLADISATQNNEESLVLSERLYSQLISADTIRAKSWLRKATAIKSLLQQP